MHILWMGLGRIDIEIENIKMDMKKFILPAAAALVLFAGCSSESDSLRLSTDAQSASPIDFGTYFSNGAVTRAGAPGAINTTDTLKASEGFRRLRRLCLLHAGQRL